MKNREIDSRLLSQKEAAAYLGISYWKLRDLVASGKIIHLQIGRRILLDVQDLEDFIERAKNR